MGRIPVRNLWLLMLYASDLYRVHGTLPGDAEGRIDELPDLLAELLARRVEGRLARGLTLGYRTINQKSARVRGRIDLLRTMSQDLPRRGLVACRLDELTWDTPRHRLALHALEKLARLVHDGAISRRCRRLVAALQARGVRAAVPLATSRGAERYGRHDADDRAMVDIAWLAIDLALPTEETGSRTLDAPDREGTWVRRLFERAVGGFYATVLDGSTWTVSRGTELAWPMGRRTAGISRVFPSRMKTDIVVDHRPSGRRLVIDTKFNEILVEGWYRDESLRSGYVYQMYAYLRSQAAGGDLLADGAGGLLLHPSVGREVDETVELHTHALRFATVDLAAPSSAIRARLLELVEPVTWAGWLDVRPRGTTTNLTAGKSMSEESITMP